jgi:hypothetical protein
MRDFGELLIEAEELCKTTNTRFEDYVDRVLGLHRSAARVLMKMRAFDIDPALGFENMKTVAALRSEEDRQAAQNAFRAGKSPDMVKAEFGKKTQEKEPSEQLRQEKKRIERTIASLSLRLEEIEKRLGEIGS